MDTITTEDGTRLYFKDWGKGQPIVFSHGWPLNADAWDEQLVFFASKGYRVIAHDRRGHGRSSQPWSGHAMNTYADDLAFLIQKLDLRDVVLVGHSTGGGEVTRTVARHGTSRVAKLALVGAIPPLLLKSEQNPAGLPRSVFDELRHGLATNRSQFYADLAVPFYGANRPGSKVPKGVLEQFWLWSMQAGLNATLECITAFSETDFTEDLKKISIPTLFIHGDDDQIVPFQSSAPLASKLVKNSVLKVYSGAPHGLSVTHRDPFNADLLAFVQG